MKITLLKSLLLLGAFVCFGAIQAQTVSGTVSDPSGPLPGASVVVKGTTNGTQTDFDGNYTLNDVASDATLVFSYIGFASQEVAVNGRSTINVTLVEDATALDEVVIIGYGQTTVKDATGSVTAVTSEDFNTGIINSPEQLIQGKAAGVNITQSSGEPGAGISVNIRGSNSVRGNNNPLFVVDGVPLFGENVDASGTSGENAGSANVGNPLNFLNPSDIESISILKDASATAIYGSRGANGVVIITTKSGKAGSGGTFEFTSNLAIATPVRQFDLLNREEYLNALPDFGGSAAANDFGGRTDWQEFLLRTTASTNNNLAYSQNYGSGNIRATFGYQKQFGIIEKSEFERIVGRVNWTQRLLDDKLILGVQGTISRINQEQPPIDAGAGFRGDILGAAYSANPTVPNANPNIDPGGGLINPANYLNETQNITNTNRILLNGTVEYKFTPELAGKVNLGYDKSDSENVSVLSSNLRNFNGITSLGFGTFNNLERENRTLEATLSFNKEFENSRLTAVAGFAYQDFRTFGFNSQGRGFGSTNLNTMSRNLTSVVNDALDVIDGSFQQFAYGVNTDLVVNRLFPNPVTETIAAGFNREVSSVTFDNFDNTDELQSFFARAEYSIANKYTFTGTFRADGSSRFGPENQYGYFPSGAFAWQIGEEDFIGDNISTLKLRLSAGLVGNQDGLGFGNFVLRERFFGIGTQNSLEIFPDNFGTGPVAFERSDLKWEETFNLNFGLDFGFNNDRFNGSIDVYRSDTQDLLLQLPPAFPSPNAFQFGNVDASVINQGIELALGYDFVQTEDVNFSANFNIAYNENEIQDFDGAINTGEINGPGLSGAFAQRFEAGRSLFSYYMAEFVGFENGIPLYADGNGGTSANPDFQSFVGEDGLPDVTTGLSLNASVKNWDFSTFFAGQFGFSVYNNTANALFNAGQLGTARNVTSNVLTEGEDPGASTAVSTRFLEKGDFVRFQNATIGYNVPLSEDSSLKNLRFSVTGQNLALFTDYSGVDPEVNVATATLGSGVPTRGVDWSAFPRPLTVTIGVNATF